MKTIRVFYKGDYIDPYNLGNKILNNLMGNDLTSGLTVTKDIVLIVEARPIEETNNE